MSENKKNKEAENKDDSIESSKSVTIMKNTKKKDENEVRGNWSGKFDFFLSCLGYAVGLGNVWRFPYLCYRNGGAVFLIPYIIMLVLVGIPIFLLELSIGQFTSRGPLNSWEMSPIFKGIGVAMLLVSGGVSIYYNVIIAWSLYYLFASFKTVLPWTTCGNEWNSLGCYDKKMITVVDCLAKGFDVDNKRGLCLFENSVEGYTNITMAQSFGLGKISSAEEYMNCYVLSKCDADVSLDNLGQLSWKLALCLLLAWIIMFSCLCRGIKSSGKVVYVTAIFPYIVLFILFIRGLTLEGSQDGIDFYIRNIKWERLGSVTVWKDAAAQIFFSLSTSWGGLIALSSYNKFHNNVFRDSLLIPILNCATSVFAGFVIFSFLGYLAHTTNSTVDQVVAQGPSLAFIAYPYAVSTLEFVPQLWAVLFFIMLITLGMDSQFALIETVATSVMDFYPKARGHKTKLIALLCVKLYIIGLLLCTQGGSYILTLMDSYIGSWNLMSIAILECIMISYVYGLDNICDDIRCILSADKNIDDYKLKNKVDLNVELESVESNSTESSDCSVNDITYDLRKNKNELSLKLFNKSVLWWKLCWSVFTPLLIIFVIILSWVDYQSLSDGNYKFPVWADAIGWIMTISILSSVLIYSIVLVVKTPGSLLDRIEKLSSVSELYRPDLFKHQILAKHHPFYKNNIEKIN